MTGMYGSDEPISDSYESSTFDPGAEDTLLPTGYPFDVTDVLYGAIGDGAVDDTAAIQAALDAAGTAGGGIVMIPPGTYMVDATANQIDGVYGGLQPPSNVSINIDPRATLRAKATDATSSSVIFIPDGVDNVEIYGGGSIDANRDAHIGVAGEWGNCIVVRGGATNVKIRDLTLLNAWGDGIELKPSDVADINTRPRQVVIDRVRSDNCRRQGISITGAKDIVVMNSIFENTIGTNPSCGCDLEADNAATPNENIKFINCTFRNNAGPAVSIGGASNKNVHFITCNMEAGTDTYSLDSHGVDRASFHGCKFLGPILYGANCDFFGCKVVHDGSYTASDYAIDANYDAGFRWFGGEVVASGGGKLAYLSGSTTENNAKFIFGTKMEMVGNGLADLDLAILIGLYARVENVRFVHSGAAPTTGYTFSTDLTTVRFRNCYIDPLVGRTFANGIVSFDPEAGLFANSGYNCLPGRAKIRGDENPTVQAFYDEPIQRFTTPFTADHTLSLSTVTVWEGAEFQIFVSDTNGHTLTVAGVALSGTNKSLRVMYNGTSWVPVGA